MISYEGITSVVAGISAERAQSLQVRLDNEDLLLDRAQERPLFGWGAWGRERVYGERGENISLTDGYWLIVLGKGGWIRYLGEFGLLAVGILGLTFGRGRGLHPASTAIALALTANLIDLVPNAGMSSLTWMLAGALAGLLERQGSEASTNEEAEASMGPVPPGHRAPTQVFSRKQQARYQRDKARSSPTTSRKRAP